MKASYYRSVFAVLIIILFSNSITQAEDSRWHVVATPYGHDTVSVDTETMEYNKEDNTLSFWINSKQLTKKKTYMVTRSFQVINYKYKTCTLKRNITYIDDYIDDTANKGRDVISSVLPDTIDYLVAEYATQTLNAPKLFPTPVENWKWVMSTDLYTCSISPDSFMDDRGYYNAYIRKAYLSGSQNFDVYRFDFNNDKIVDIDYYSNISYKDIIPESVDEKIYKAAYEMYIRNKY